MKLQNILTKYQKYLIVIAIVLSSLAISIRSRKGEVTFVLQNHPIIIFLMIVLSSFLVVLYVHIGKKKIEDLSNQIKEQSKEEGEDFNSLLVGLTTRQKEVYDLIISGKSNKEIIAELFIEQSTLKTHVNQIYRKLNIKTRHELKSKVTD